MDTVTLNQIAYNIAENMGDTSDVLIRRLHFTVLYYRAMILRRDYSRNNHLPESVLQELIFDLEPVTVGSDKFLRTKTKIPTTVRLKGPVFQYFGGIDRKTPYAFVYPEQREYVNEGKFNCKPPVYSYLDGYGEVYNITASKILVRHVFENPMEAGLVGNGICKDPDSPFPIPLDMVEAITKGILSGEMQVRDQEADKAGELQP